MPILCIIFGLLFSASAWAYPEFIGYKYASCLTCHYNGQGNGPLNDYGRALWASEIGGRLTAFGRSDEQLGEASGFLGSAQMPWWIRPGLKGRYMAVRPNPGAQGELRTILMQAEANVAVFFDRDQKKTFVGSYGYIPVPRRLKGNPGDTKTWISREHYFRWAATDSLWVYAGMMDKVYGIRIANHMAYSRMAVGLNQNDQAHGLALHYIKPTWEFTLHGFAGNLFQKAELRQAGASMLAEVEVAEAWRLGLTALSSSNKFVANQRIGLLSRSGLGHGSAILFEGGLLIDKPKSTEKTQGYYIFSEAMQRFTRGYHIFVSGQAYKDNMVAGRANNLVASFGLLAFPMQRVEFRIEFENFMKYSESSEVSKDTWQALAQIHVSL
ncbi:MAG: hypothetical protein KF799_01020 [Bdellovibrionales bacterium]|nr:hypothetical protein [Bdellovibrionales bacterium]